MSPEETIELLRRFVVYVTIPGEKSDKSLLELCDRIVVSYHSVAYSFDSGDYEDAPHQEYSARRAKVNAAFPEYGHYCLSCADMTSLNDGAMVGDAIDDLADLVGDFEEVIWYFEHTSKDDALWHFHNGYWTHWGRHMRELQLYLYRRVVGS